MFSKQAQDDIWGENPDTLVSTSYGPRGTVKKVEGGYELNGRWMFSSGVIHSGWTIVGGFVGAENDRRQQYFFLVPAKDRKILDDWDVMGMAASGSNSFLLENAFVPEHRALDGALVLANNPPGSKVNDEPLHRMPIFGFTGTVLVSTAVGVAMGMVKEFESILKKNAGPPPGKPGTEEMMVRLAEATSEVECARLLVLDSARRNMARLRAGKILDEGDAGLTSRNSAYVAKLVRQAATRLMEAAGGSGLTASGYMQRAFRDAIGGTAHTTLNWGRSNARYGYHLLGWPPGLPF
jgi:3-hydroxy-9,10-secoandrosta-1,3,5(10)-triene-9,17-dione monooxygenase